MNEKSFFEYFFPSSQSQNSNHIIYYNTTLRIEHIIINCKCKLNMRRNLLWYMRWKLAKTYFSAKISHVKLNTRMNYFCQTTHDRQRTRIEQISPIIWPFSIPWSVTNSSKVKLHNTYGLKWIYTSLHSTKW